MILLSLAFAAENNVSRLSVLRALPFGVCLCETVLCVESSMITFNVIGDAGRVVVCSDVVLVCCYCCWGAFAHPMPFVPPGPGA